MDTTATGLRSLGSQISLQSHRKIISEANQISVFFRALSETRIFWNTEFQHGKVITYNGRKLRTISKNKRCTNLGNSSIFNIEACFPFNTSTKI